MDIPDNVANILCWDWDEGINMDCSFMNPSLTIIPDIWNCLMVSMGLPFEYFALGIIAAFILFAAISRLDFDFSLAGAITLTWALMVMSGPFGGSVMLSQLMALLLLGLALRLLIAFISIFRQ